MPADRDIVSSCGFGNGCAADRPIKGAVTSSASVRLLRASVLGCQLCKCRNSDRDENKNGVNHLFVMFMFSAFVKNHLSRILWFFCSWMAFEFPFVDDPEASHLRDLEC